MTRPVTLSPVYNALTGNVSMANLDTTFGQVASALNELSNSSVFVVDTGAVNALAVNAAPATVNISAGTTLDILVSNTNTGAATLTVAGSTGVSGVVPVKDGQGNTLTAGVLLGNTVYRLIYDGTVWRASGTLASGGTGPIAASSLTVSGASVLGMTTVNTASGPGLIVSSGASNNTNTLELNTAGSMINFARSSDGAMVGYVGSRAGTSSYSLYNAGGSTAEVEAAGGIINLKTNNLVRLLVAIAGNITVNSPASGDSLTLNNTVGGLCLSVVSSPGANGIQVDATPTAQAPIKLLVSAATSRVLSVNSGFNTGSGVPTLTANKPGGPNGVFHWMRVDIGAGAGYIPIFGL